jgi:hypothetical protein
VAPLTRPEAVTLALYALEGHRQPAGTEDVAIRVAELVPGMFAWQKYPEQIDKELVRVALSDARLKKKWIVGSHNKGGWMLTPAGQAFARARAESVDGVAASPRQRGRDEQQLTRERLRLESSPAYTRALTGSVDDVTDDEADAFFRINVYVVGQARERKIARIENQFGDDPGIGRVVRALAARARERDANGSESP